MLRSALNTSRLIKWSFTHNGLVHLATCYDGEPSYHVVLGKTLCDKDTNPHGGWGHSSNRNCEHCWNVGAPAECLKF